MITRKKVTDEEKNRILRDICKLMYDGINRGIAIKQAAKNANRPYITVRYHFDKWVKESLTKQFF